MELQMTYDDPKTFTKPIHITLAVNYVPDTEMLEYVCNENERDSAHLVGKASGEVKGAVNVSAAVLSQYAENYKADDSGDNVGATLTLRDGQVVMAMAGKGSIPLTTLSETKFYFPGGFPIDFFKDSHGA